MNTNYELEEMTQSQLIAEIVKLQGLLSKYRPDQYHASLVHNYHFESSHVSELHRDRYIGSGVILAIYDLSGKPKVEPVMIKDGLSDNTINAILDDFQYSYDKAVEFKPITKRVKTTKGS